MTLIGSLGVGLVALQYAVYACSVQSCPIYTYMYMVKNVPNGDNVKNVPNGDMYLWMENCI